MATIFVSSLGSGSQDGSSASNAISISTFESTCSGGNTYTFVDGTYTDINIRPLNSGSAGNYITVTCQTRHGAQFTGVSGNVIFDLETNSNSYFDFYQLDFDGGGIYRSSNITNCIRLKSSHYIKVRDCKARNIQGWGGLVHCVGWNDDSSYVRLVDNDCDYCGTWNRFDDDGIYEDAGSWWGMGESGHHWYVARNKFVRGGHDCGRLVGYNHYVGDNEFSNYWGNFSGTEFDHIKTGDKTGNRSFEIALGGNNYIIEDNFIHDTGEPADQFTTGANKIGGTNTIWRGNTYASLYNWGPGFYDRGRNLRLIAVYNNTIYNCAGPLFFAYLENSLNPAIADYEHVKIYNNLIYKTRQDITVMNPNSSETDSAGELSAARARYEADMAFYKLQTLLGVIFPDGFEFAGNVVGRDEGSVALTDFEIYHQDVAASNESLSWFETNYASNFHDNTGSEPGLSTEPPTARTHFELLSTSNARGAGVDIPLITSATGSGTSFDVDYAVPFHDGYGILDENDNAIAGDTIDINGTQYTVTGVIYNSDGSGTITVSSTASWTNGDAVHVYKYLNGTAVDAGAIPFGGSGGIAANSDSFTISKNASATDLDVLANDDGSSLTVVSHDYSGSSTLVVKGDSSALTFTPDTDYVGTINFNYVITDGSTSATGAATITVIDDSVDYSGKIVEHDSASYSGDFSDVGDYYEVDEQA